MTIPYKRQGIAIVALLVISLFATCTDPVEGDEPTDPGGEEITTDDANELANSFVFDQSTEKSGSTPGVPNTSMTRMNGKDTIYMIEGYKIPLRISSPEGRSIAGIFFTVKNATHYYDIPATPEEDSDTVSVVYIDIDIDNTNPSLPKEFPVKITPYDENNDPIDVIERIVALEEKSPPACDITANDTTTSWYWTSSTSYNPNDQITFQNFPNKRHKTHATYQGCCDTATGYNCGEHSSELNAYTDADLLYIIVSEKFAFYQNGTFWRRTHERSQNFDPIETQWCNGVPAYTETNGYVTYTGTHNFSPGATSLSYATTYVSCDLCGYGSPGGSLAYSCNLMIIVRNTAEGSKQVRIYMRDYIDEWSI